MKPKSSCIRINGVEVTQRALVDGLDLRWSVTDEARLNLALKRHFVAGPKFGRSFAPEARKVCKKIKRINLSE